MVQEGTHLGGKLHPPRVGLHGLLRLFVHTGCSEWSVSVPKVGIGSGDICDPVSVLIGIQIQPHSKCRLQFMRIHGKCHVFKLIDDRLVGDIKNTCGIVKIAYNIRVFLIIRAVFAV